MHTKPSPYRSIRSIFAKDVLGELRSRFGLSTLSMFAIMTLSSISISIGGESLSAALSAALLWIVLFFSAMSGLSRVFIQEQDAGTLLTLRIYAPPQAVLFGKMLFNMTLLIGLSCLLVPLFLIFFGIEVQSWFWFITVLLLGVVGMAIVTTMTAAISAQSRSRSSLLTILTFPILLPQFISAISTTALIFSGGIPDSQQIIFLLAYDIVTAFAVSILFDYLWY